MTFRGTFINGVVIPDAGQQLPEGMRVRFSPLATGNGKRAHKATSPVSKAAKVRSKAQKRPRHEHPLTALAGIWKDRQDWKGKSSTDVVAELRRRPGKARG